MEKAAPNNNKLKNKILKLLPKVISFQNIPFSPRRDTRPDRPKTHHNKAFSGPIIPAEARRKLRSFETFTHEPTSPKVTCTGRVKHKGRISEKTKTKKKHVSLPKEIKPVSLPQPVKKTKKKKKKAGMIKKFLRGERKCVEVETSGLAGPDGGSAPSLSHMRKFASSRDTFANFDWVTAAQIAPEDCSDGERAYSDGDYDDDDDDECGVPFSAPILTAGELEPTKEINLWKRRTMAQPRSLELDLDE
ncbi:hypothetical protein SASPL_113083 [Salvia splendens]|uniref:Syringolide-induced protein 14-1-1 n=1 Tax=Salvia splendens TaxID=180675 RepID=A0A8X8Y2Z5_SALSN|nr:uncharacterized protein At1g76070-like [Salvia splendens]KAG6422705.1 hypothetical protein SASPL_113083 [Salvia splendens]